MGLGDRFKDMAKQAQESVAEHKDQLHGAVDAAGIAADRRTRGKHSARIAKIGQKASAAVDKLGGEVEQPGAAAAQANPPAGASTAEGQENPTPGTPAAEGTPATPPQGVAFDPLGRGDEVP